MFSIYSLIKTKREINVSQSLGFPIEWALANKKNTFVLRKDELPKEAKEMRSFIIIQTLFASY